MKLYGMIDTVLVIPFTEIHLELGWFYYVFALVFITGMINSVNLTDGIDGLAASVTCVVAAFFAVLAFYVRQCRSCSIGWGDDRRCAGISSL